MLAGGKLVLANGIRDDIFLRGIFRVAILFSAERGEAMNLIEGLLKEIGRNRELLTQYESIPQGLFGATMIRQDIAKAEQAMCNNDVAAMVFACKELQGNK